MVQMLVRPIKQLLKQILSTGNRIRVRIRTGNRQTIWLFTSMALGLLRKNPVGRYLSSGPASIHLLARVLQAANSVSCKHVVFMLLLAICVLYWSLWRIVKSCKNNFFIQYFLSDGPLFSYNVFCYFSNFYWILHSVTILMLHGNAWYYIAINYKYITLPYTMNLMVK